MKHIGKQIFKFGILFSSRVPCLKIDDFPAPLLGDLPTWPFQPGECLWVCLVSTFVRRVRICKSSNSEYGARFDFLSSWKHQTATWPSALETLPGDMSVCNLQLPHWPVLSVFTLAATLSISWVAVSTWLTCLRYWSEKLLTTLTSWDTMYHMCILWYGIFCKML